MEKKVLVIEDLKKFATEILGIAAADDVQLIQDYLETCLVDPADLDKMNLAALKVLGEVNAWLQKEIKFVRNSSLPNDPYADGRVGSLEATLTFISMCEFSVDLEELREILVQAEAWKMMSDIRAETPDKEDYVRQVKEDMQTIFALAKEAQAELNKEKEDQSG